MFTFEQSESNSLELAEISGSFLNVIAAECLTFQAQDHPENYSNQCEHTFREEKVVYIEVLHVKQEPDCFDFEAGP